MSEAVARCRVVPQANHEVAFEVGDRECLRWHFGAQYPRPFLFPVRGPSGHPLTRMGHPGAANHDHHRSVWFAHAKAMGVDFWSDNTDARIRQAHWFSYEDGDEESVMSAQLNWYDGHDPRELLRQEAVIALRPLADQEYVVELQSRFVPVAETFEFQQTNFGFLAVRVARSISEHFGAGVLTSSRGRVHEANLFGRAAEWVDYSGPVGTRAAALQTEGITYFDHRQNPGFPNKWHVRADGWMGCSPCLEGPLLTTGADPLMLRFQLHIHSGPVDSQRAAHVAEDFYQRPPFEVQRTTEPHRQFRTRRRT